MMKLAALALCLLSPLARGASITRPSVLSTGGSGGGGSTPFTGGFVPNFTEFGSSVQIDGMLAGSSETLSGTITVASSDTASAFFGDGSHLTGISTGTAVCLRGAGAQSVLCDGLTNSANGPQSVVSGGSGNSAPVSGAAVVGGGNNIVANIFGFIGGGQGNQTNGVRNVISGGNVNQTNGTDSVVSGGASNNASADFATVGGGAANNASGVASTVIGGISNIAAGAHSVAGGGTADALADGTWAMADDTGAGVIASTINGVAFSYAGGYDFISGASTASFRNGFLTAPFYLAGYLPNPVIDLSAAQGGSDSAGYIGTNFWVITSVYPNNVVSDVSNEATLTVGGGIHKRVILTWTPDPNALSYNIYTSSFSMNYDSMAFLANVAAAAIPVTLSQIKLPGTPNQEPYDARISSYSIIHDLTVDTFTARGQANFQTAVAASSVIASAFFGDGSHLTGLPSTLAHAGGFSSTLNKGSTFFAFVPDQNITLKRITVTVIVAGIGGAGDTYACQDNAGNSISVTVSAAAGAGSVTTATGSASIASGVQVNGLLSTSAAATSPVVNTLCEYSSP